MRTNLEIHQALNAVGMKFTLHLVTTREAHDLVMSNLTLILDKLEK